MADGGRCSGGGPAPREVVVEEGRTIRTDPLPYVWRL